MVGSTIPDDYKNVTLGNIILEKYVQLGANTIVLPNVIIKEGAATGAMTLVNKDLEGWNLYVGAPSQKLKERSQNLIELVKKYEKR